MSSVGKLSRAASVLAWVAHADYSIVSDANDLTAKAHHLITGYHPSSDVSLTAKADLDQKEIMGAVTIDRATIELTWAATTTVPVGAAWLAAKNNEKIMGYITEEVTCVKDQVCQMKFEYRNDGEDCYLQADLCFTAAGGVKLTLDNAQTWAAEATSVGAITAPAIRDPTKAEQAYKVGLGQSEHTLQQLAKFDNEGPHQYFSVFYAFHQSKSYPDDIITAALAEITKPSPPANFPTQTQLVKKTASYTIIWMRVVSAMEEAVEKCSSVDAVAPDTTAAKMSWDKAVAYYSGSLEGETELGTKKGYFMFSLAVKRCATFQSTCSKVGDKWKANVNVEILKRFTDGLKDLDTSSGMPKCMDLLRKKQEIASWMTIPSIQGSIRYAWRLQNKWIPADINAVTVEEMNTLYKWRGEARAFWHVYKPLVMVCDEKAYDDIEMEFSKDLITDKVDYQKVLAKLNVVYPCMGLAPELIGTYED